MFVWNNSINGWFAGSTGSEKQISARRKFEETVTDPCGTPIAAAASASDHPSRFQKESIDQRKNRKTGDFKVRTKKISPLKVLVEIVLDNSNLSLTWL